MDNNPINLTDVKGLDPKGDYIEEDVTQEEFEENFGKERESGVYYEGKYDANGKFSGIKFTPVKEWEPKDEGIESENEIGVDANVGNQTNVNQVKPLPQAAAPSKQTIQQKNVTPNTNQKLEIKPPVTPTTPKPHSITNQNKITRPWMDYAIAESKKGVKENKEKGQHNSDIIKYIKSTNIGSEYWSDETSWCASFAHWSLQQAGIKGSGAKGDNWRGWGTKLEQPAQGAIVIFNSGHVAMVMGKTSDGKLVIIHGNWSDKISISPEGWGFTTDDIKDIRYPNGYTPNYNLPVIDKKNFL